MLENILILSGAVALFALYYGTPILFQHLRSRFNAMQEDSPEPEPDRLDYPAAMAAIDQIQEIRERLDKLEELITYLEITPPESQQVTCSTAFQSEDTKQHTARSAFSAALPAILTAAKAERAALRQSLSSLLQLLPETAVRHGQNGRQNSDQTQTEQTPIFRGGVVEKGA